MTEMPETLGLILAGGLARRMGGGDKPLRRVDGRTVLERVADALRPQTAGLLLNANGDPTRFAPFRMPVVPDPLPDHPGPLAGVLAGLEWALAHRPGLDWVLAVPGDAPFLPGDLARRLHAARAEVGVPLACAASGGWTHPVVGLWPVALAPTLRAAVTGGLGKIDAFTAAHGVVAVEWPSEPRDPFFNANRPEDLDEAERQLRLAPGG